MATPPRSNPRLMTVPSRPRYTLGMPDPPFADGSHMPPEPPPAPPGDCEKAVELPDEAIAIATELGMKPLLERVLAKRKILKA